jgi:hypothetical protein
MSAPKQDFTLDNLLAQALDVAGSLVQDEAKTLSDEPAGYGQALTGQSGLVANVVAVGEGPGGDEATITGLTNMYTSSLGRFITFTSFANGANNGTFLITHATGSGVGGNTTVRIINASAVGADSNGHWDEREPYMLEDDVNFIRTDRKAIKGTLNWHDAIPTYERCTAIGTAVTASLQNLVIAKPTDAIGITQNRVHEPVTAISGASYFTLTGSGIFQWADAVDRTGVPLGDSGAEADSGSFYVEIIDPTTEAAMEVLSGSNAGHRIFGVTRSGSATDGAIGRGADEGATENNFVEVHLRSVVKGQHISSSVQYTWESGHPLTITAMYGYRSCLSNISDTALRTVLSNGIVGDADMNQDIVDIRTTIDESFTDGATSLAGLLTNTGVEYVFSDLPDATPSVVEALNTLNTQIGDRTYDCAPLVNGETIAASLLKLCDEIAVSASAGSVLRTIARLTASVDANTVFTLPGGLTYVVDGAFNGSGLWVYWRGVLKDPGTVALGDDYDETSTTTITPYSKIKDGDHINFFIVT